jgi:nicotinamidase-related amidase
LGWTKEAVTILWVISPWVNTAHREMGGAIGTGRPNSQPEIFTARNKEAYLPVSIAQPKFRVRIVAAAAGEKCMASTLSIAGPVSEHYAEMARRPLEANNCALIVVDIQEKLLPPIFQKEQLIRNSSLLIRLAEMLKIPVLMTTQYATGLGRIVPEITSLLPQTAAIDKQAFSCFGSEAFCSLLKRLPGTRNTVLLCGMESHICVMQTALSALREGYLVHVASDAVGSRTEWNWKIGLERMRAAGAVISSTEMAIYELLGSSNSSAFKAILQHLR